MERLKLQHRLDHELLRATRARGEYIMNVVLSTSCSAKSHSIPGTVGLLLLSGDTNFRSRTQRDTLDQAATIHQA
ncbi:uncharacterized protein BJX67DRAFT_359292 [Aspergillus lucknowensis]|uniref:Uncharacterized protein n=1 Tax=Aspergillus lucknowensis TaxID=176173 RepID=A0ABR4LKQ9_9EURO